MKFNVRGTYKDGGSKTIEYNNKIYSIDYRINSKTKGRVYTNRHPSEGKLVSSSLESEILEAYQDYLNSKVTPRYNSFRKWYYVKHQSYYDRSFETIDEFITQDYNKYSKSIPRKDGFSEERYLLKEIKVK
jgi:hypothetical protein